MPAAFYLLPAWMVLLLFVYTLRTISQCVNEAHESLGRIAMVVEGFEVRLKIEHTLFSLVVVCWPSWRFESLPLLLNDSSMVSCLSFTAPTGQSDTGRDNGRLASQEERSMGMRCSGRPTLIPEWMRGGSEPSTAEMGAGP
jgi:hypothetical protein